MMKKHCVSLGVSLALALSYSVALPGASYADGQETTSCEGSGNPSGSDFSAGCTQYNDVKKEEPAAQEPIAPAPTMSPEEQKKFLEENYTEVKLGDQVVYYAPKNGNWKNCLQADTLEPGTLDTKHRVDMVDDKYVGAAGPKAPGIPSCVSNKDKPNSDEDSKQEYEKKVIEAKKAFSDMTIATPELQFNDNTDPNVWVDKNINFYVKLGDAKTRKTSALNGEVQIEAVPVHYHIDTGNGESYNTYTAGGPINLRETEEMPKTQTSYVYEKTGNFHAYVTVTYEGRYRFGSGPWVPITEKVSKRSGATLVRVWTSEVHSVAKTCDEDPAGWACPLNEKYRDFNNPNPKLRRPDPVTGQRWHKDDTGEGDTEWRLHPKWPDM